MQCGSVHTRVMLFMALFLFPLFGMPTDAQEQGRFGKALDARKGRLEVPGHESFDGLPLTVECWAKLFGKDSYNILVAKDNKHSSRHWELFTVRGTGKYTVYLPGYSPDHIRTEVDIVDGKWHHLAMTHTGSRVKLFIDGVLKADSKVKPRRSRGPAGNLAIGGLVEGRLYCNGLIDEVRISKTIRKFGEVPKEAPQVDKDTVGLWHLDEIKGDRFADASNNGHTAMRRVAHPAVTSGPRCLDDELTIELFAEAPEVVTPVGIAEDKKDRLLVLESNTHFPPKGYKRHPTDRILVMQDKNNDGKADKVTVFADGFKAAMHLTVHPSGDVYVATRGALIRLRDKDGDGKAEERKTVLSLKTSCTYPHNGIFSCTFDWANNMYVSMGENLGADYELIGTDGSVVKGGGEGGNIFVATPDGEKVKRFATGFWNPVQLHFDVFGRMFTVDNDPDSRPPCRLLHIVSGGDYGYRFRNGRPGLHPFTAWNGELPGTLPMVAGTGEAPSGLMTAEYGILPQKYRGTMLVTSWGEHRIDYFRLSRKGASFRAERKPLVVGPSNFRPVGMVAASDGCIYVTDWVDRSYQLHGKGKVWRIRRKDNKVAKSGPPEKAILSKNRDIREAAARTLAKSDEGRGVLKRVYLESEEPRVRATAFAAHLVSGDIVWEKPKKTLEELDLEAGLGEAELEDPFVHTAVRNLLVQSPKVLQKVKPLRLKNARQKLVVLLAMREAGIKAIVPKLPQFLKSPDEDVQFVVIQWIGEERLKQHRDALVKNLDRPSLSGDLFAASLTSLALIDGARPSEAARGGQIYLERILTNDKSTTTMMRQALRRLSPKSNLMKLANFKKWIESKDTGLQLEAIRTMRYLDNDDKFELFAGIARDSDRPARLRAEALVALGDSSSQKWSSLLVGVLRAKASSVRGEALRSLRGMRLEKGEKVEVERVQRFHPGSMELVARVLAPNVGDKRPGKTDLDAWLSLLQGPADPEAGERIFYHAKSAGCYRCHRFNGRGNMIGPDLSRIGQTMDRKRLLESILQPSKEIAPSYTQWAVQLRNGRLLKGIMLGESPEGIQTYANSDGRLFRVAHADIERRVIDRTSLMPHDLVDRMALQELRDLLAFLEGTAQRDTRTTTPRKDVPETSKVKMFRSDNLVAWCIVPFDAKKRGPQERVAMLKRLGLKKVAYDWRARHLPSFDKEVKLYKKNGIELVGVWCPPGNVNRGHVKTILDVLAKNKVRTQLWVSAGGKDVKGAASVIRPIAIAAQKIGCKVGLYNHGGWFGDPVNQMAIIEHLGLDNLGIVYNFHHGHSHMDRFPGLLKKMKPYLLCLNLNGMDPKSGISIMPFGQGKLDRQIMQWIVDSEYDGPIGILDHRGQVDAERSLEQNMEGVAKLRRSFEK
ncbi:MAG: PVC-type heme-binding CxxCH protein [Gemmataceae bacterium]